MAMRDDIDVLFKALADPGKTASCWTCCMPLTAAHSTRLCEHLDMTRQGVTQHLDLLEAANLVAERCGMAAKNCTS